MKRVATLVAGALFLGVLSWVVLDRRVSPNDGAESAASPRSSGRFSFAWIAGTRYEYALRWTSNEKVIVDVHQGLSFEGAADFSGRLSLTSYGLRDGTYLLGARLYDLERRSLVIAGRDPMPDEETFRDRDALYALGTDGRIRSVYFAKDAPPVFRHVMTSVATELSVTVPADAQVVPGHGWSLDEETALGVAHVRYDVQAKAELTRTRKGYARFTGMGPLSATVDSRGTMSIAERGHLTHLEQHDDVRASSDGGQVLSAKDDFLLDLQGTAAVIVTSPTLEGLDRITPGAMEGSAASESALLDQQIAGLTLHDLLTQLVLMKDGKMADKSRFIWRATGLLERDPEACADLGRALARKDATPTQRALGLDLLAGAGHSKAQAAMREALANDTLKSEKSYPLLLQRFTLLRHPDAASEEFVGELYHDASNADVRYASAYSLGAMADRLAHDGDKPTADKYADELKSDLGNAKTDSERANLLTALGAAARPGDLPTIDAAAGSPSDAVRRAAAGALYDDTTDGGLALLLRLVADPAPSVQQSALRSLTRRTLSPPTLDQLAGIVLQGTLHRTSYGDLLVLLSTRTGPSAAKMVAFIIHESDDDPQLVARARHVLEDMAGR